MPPCALTEQFSVYFFIFFPFFLSFFFLLPSSCYTFPSLLVICNYISNCAVFHPFFGPPLSSGDPSPPWQSALLLPLLLTAYYPHLVPCNSLKLPLQPPISAIALMTPIYIKMLGVRFEKPRTWGVTISMVFGDEGEYQHSTTS